MVFLPFHWGESFDREAPANGLTHRRVDAVSQQPELKHLAARLEPAPAGWDHPPAEPHAALSPRAVTP